MIAILLLACGSPDELEKPNPPPSPPPVLAKADPDVVTYTGVVSDVHGPTRSFVLTFEGNRHICHVSPNGVLSLDGKPALVGDIPPDTTLTVEGRAQGDLVIVERGATPAPKEAAPAEPAVPAAPA
ncbi:MAG: hypothetical protein ACOZNI_33885, partial [Myxococcota bacterium]